MARSFSPTSCERRPATTFQYTPRNEGAYWRDLKPGRSSARLPVPELPYATQINDGNLALIDANADGLPDVVQVPQADQSYQFLWLNTGSELRASNLNTDAQRAKQILSRSRGHSLTADWTATGRAGALFASSTAMIVAAISTPAYFRRICSPAGTVSSSGCRWIRARSTR